MPPWDGVQEVTIAACETDRASEALAPTACRHCAAAVERARRFERGEAGPGQL